MNKAETQTTSAQSPRRLRRRILIGLCALVVLSGGSVFFVATKWSDRLGEAIARADRLDPRWRFDDIQNDRLPVPPSEQNGMAQIMAVDAARDSGGFGNWSLPELENKLEELAEWREAMNKSLEGEPKFPAILTDEQAHLLTAEIAKNSEALRLSRTLVNFPYGRYSITYPGNFWTMNLAPYQKAREVGNMLRYDALLRAHNRDLVGALDDV
ncbi:hypothetical protein BH10PLA2_BH10PLA2_32470 [soil metagenome]